MKKKYITALAEASGPELLQVVQIAVALYHRYTGMLPVPSFRKQIIEHYPDVWPLLDALYMHKLCTRKELTQRLRDQESRSEHLQGASSAPQIVEKALKQTKWHIEPTDELWLMLRWQGKIYKRSLSKDVAKMLKRS